MHKRQNAAIGQIKALILRLQASLKIRPAHVKGAIIFPVSCKPRSWAELSRVLKIIAGDLLANELNAAIIQVSLTLQMLI